MPIDIGLKPITVWETQKGTQRRMKFAYLSVYATNRIVLYFDTTLITYAHHYVWTVSRETVDW